VSINRHTSGQHWAAAESASMLMRGAETASMLMTALLMGQSDNMLMSDVYMGRSMLIC